MFGRSFILFCILSVVFGTPYTRQESETDVVNNLLFDDKVPTPHQVIEEAGYKAETHEVVTEDRYVLQLDRITGSKAEHSSKKKPAVLVVHGLLDCSIAWVLPGPGKGLGYLLSDWGYDVWMGNVRGNRYSRKHLDFTVSDPKYWDFSWHEVGIYDLPAMIDRILEETKQEKLFVVTHSQGGTAFFVMASERIEYQKKVIASFAMAPAVFMSRTKNALSKVLAPFANSLHLLANLIGVYEFKPSSDLLHLLTKEVCKEESFLSPVCQNIMFLINGEDKDLNMTLLANITQYDPAGGSVKQFVHFGQSIATGKFQKYDYGLVGNLQKYKQLQPPDYDLSNIGVPVYLYYGQGDVVVDVMDIHELHDKLRNVQKFLAPSDSFTHLDFTWGKHADVWVYDKILSTLQYYRK